MSIQTNFSYMVKLIPAQDGQVISEADRVAGIHGLQKSACSGDHDAVEMLLNLSAGPSESAVAQAATDALVNLYGSPTTLQSVRDIIGFQASRLFEQQQAILTQRQERSLDPREAPVRLAVPVLYLAGQYAHQNKQTALEANINRALNQRCFTTEVLEAQREEDLLSRGRLVRSEELLAVGAKRAALPVHRVCLELTPPAESPSFAEQLRKVRDAVSAEKKPRAVFLNTGMHWVTVVLFPVKLQASNLVDALVIDTNLEADLASSSPVRRAIDQALGERKSQPALMLAQAMQTNVPNACGPLCAVVTRTLDKFLANHPNAALEDVRVEVRRSIEKWTQMTAESQNGIVTAARARLLQTMDGTGRH